MLRSSSHLLGQSLLVSGTLFAWLTLLGSSWRQDGSSGLRGVWHACLACLPPVNLALPEDHDVIPLAADKSSALGVALVVQSAHGSSSSPGFSSERTKLLYVRLLPSVMEETRRLLSWAHAIRNGISPSLAFLANVLHCFNHLSQYACAPRF